MIEGETRMTHRPFSSIRGTNIFPMCSTIHNLHLALVPMREGVDFPDQTRDGFFSTVHADAEIAQMAATGINSVRVFGSFMGWYIDPSGYMRNLEYYSQKLVAYGIGMQYVLFNGTPGGLASADVTLGAAGIVSSGGGTARGTLISNWTLANAWQTHLACPGYPLRGRQLSLWPEPYAAAEWTLHGAFNPGGSAYDSLVLQYVQTIADFLATNRYGRIVDDGVELYNEANITSGDATRWALVRSFIKQCADVFRASSPLTRLGCGMAGIPGAGGDWRTQELVQSGCRVDFISLHCYETANIVPFIAAGRDEARRCGLRDDAVILSECYVLPRDSGLLSLYLDGLRAEGIGGYTWSILGNNSYTSQGPIDGRLISTTPAQDLRRNDPPRWRPAQPLDLASEQGWYSQNYV